MSASGYYNQQYESGGYGQPPPPPPNPPRPWFAEWDQREGRYIFINQQTGQRSWDFPREEYGNAGGNSYGSYGGGQGGNYDSNQGYGAPPQPQEQHPEKKSHGLLYGALGAAAGLAGGAFLMHEGSEIKDDLEGDKYRAEERFQGDEYRVEERFQGDEYRAEEGFDRFGDRVENFPEDAAEWTGRKVGEVEDIPQDIEQGFDRFGERIEDGVQDVEDIPEDVAGWAGDKVGDVERFGDEVGGAYEDGREEGRYGDDDY